MKDKLVKDITNWCEKQDKTPELYMDEFIDIVINKTANALLDELQTELKNEFESGNLKHPFIISNEYYLYLKLKEVKNKIIHPEKDNDFVENEVKKK